MDVKELKEKLSGESDTKKIRLAFANGYYTYDILSDKSTETEFILFMGDII